MVGSIDIKALTLEELSGVVNLYPWYGGARKELCRRMAAMGNAWGKDDYAAAALYIPSREKVSELVHSSEASDYSDKDIQELLKAYFERREESSGEGGGAEAGNPEVAAGTEGEKRIYVVGGDYFTQAQYEKVRRSTDNIFSSFASKARSENYAVPEDAEFDLCTETLAQIYAEQGYPQEARRIYTRLAEMDPSKSVYYFSLIEKL